MIIRKIIAGMSLMLASKESWKYYQEYKSREKLSERQLEEFQWKRIKGIISYAYQNVQYYKEKFQKAKISPDKIKTMQDFKKIPLSDTEELRSAILKGTAISREKLKTTMLHTTGSTGNPFRFPLDINADNERRGCKLRNFSWYGQYPGAKTVILWRNTAQDIMSRLKEASMSRTNITIYSDKDINLSLMTESRTKEIIAQINRLKPEFIDGYVSSLSILSRYIIKNKIKMHTPKAVISGAEFLSEEDRKIIQEAFKAKVVDRYGGTEASIMAQECLHQNLHINSDKLLLETIKDGRPAGPQEEGELLLTDFTNHAMPFIRFNLGDMAVMGTKKCSCGLKFPVMKDVIGRKNDIFHLPDGRTLSSHVWHKLFRDKAYIRQFQIIQEKINYINVNVEIDKEQLDKEGYSKLKQKVSDFLPGCKINWREGKINPGPGGKFRHSYSKIDNERIPEN